MDVMEAISKRSSVRSYRDEPVPDGILAEIMEAARLAPSASNRQPWTFIVVREDDRRQKLAEAARRQAFVGEAPVVIAGVALEPERVMTCQVPAYAVDVSIALAYITLAAVERGLGTCWIGAFEQEAVRWILEVPAEYRVVALMPLGYPEVDGNREKNRKEPEEIVRYETFSGPCGE